MGDEKEIKTNTSTTHGLLPSSVTDPYEDSWGHPHMRRVFIACASDIVSRLSQVFNTVRSYCIVKA